MSETKEKKGGIGGKTREMKDFGLVVGLAEVKVLTINPNREEFKEILGMELKDESKADEYLGESKDGNKTLRIDVWVQAIKSGRKDKITFFLEDKEKVNKDETKKQYINSFGSCSWADDPNNLPEWFLKREYRVAYNGEEELYGFLRTWLAKLDPKDAEATLQVEWKKLMKGKVDDLKDQINGAYSVNVLALYTVKTVEKEGEVKQYQSIYNKAFLPSFAIKNFKLVDYNKEEVQESIKKKKPKDQKFHEKFVLTVAGEYGCKDSYYFGELKEFKEEDFLVASDKTIESDDPSY